MLPRPCRAVLALTAAAALHVLPAPAAAAKPEPAATSTSGEPGPKASKAGTRNTSATPATKPSKPDPKASKADPKPGAKAGTKASKPDPKASPTKPDPKASPAKPDPKTSKPDPKASPTKPDPKASKPDPKASPAKPDPKASQPDPKASPAPVPKASPAPTLPPLSDGYWLGAHLLGPADAQAAATQALAADLPPAPTAPGTLGRAASLPEAMQWVARWAFSGEALPPISPSAPLPLHTGPAPRPGGALHSAHGVVLHALTITGRSGDTGTREIRWPQTAAELVPPGMPWIPAVLLAERAPLFAAPAAHVPPASERHALVRRSGSLLLLGYTDRCTAATGERVCTHWAQVITRDGDNFRAGYLPAFQVARIDGWIRGAGTNPRAQLLAVGTVGTHAQFLLVARTRDGNLRRRTVIVPLADESYPAARLRVDGEWATIQFTGAPAQRIALDSSMDTRVR